MSASAIREGSDLQFGGFYLPAITFGYLYMEGVTSDLLIWIPGVSSENELLLLATITTITGVISHISFRVITGEQGIDLTQTRVPGELYRQRLGYLLLGEASPVRYSTSLKKTALLESISIRHIARITVITTSLLVLLVSFPASVIRIWSYFPNGGSISGLLLFLNVVFVLQATVSSFIKITGDSSEQRSSIFSTLHNFESFLTHCDQIVHQKLSYRFTDGGEYGLIHEVWPAEVDIFEPSEEVTTEDIRKSISFVCLAYPAYLLSSYPAAGLTVIIAKDGEKAAAYRIDSDLADKFAKGEIAWEEYISQVHSTLIVNDAVA
jgi:hypothetical protein